jgi:hypothetical protein
MVINNIWIHAWKLCCPPLTCIYIHILVSSFFVCVGLEPWILTWHLLSSAIMYCYVKTTNIFLTSNLVTKVAVYNLSKLWANMQQGDASHSKEMQVGFKMYNYGGKCLAFLLPLCKCWKLPGLTYFNLMNKTVAKCLDMIATFCHKILYQISCWIVSLLSTILICHAICFLLKLEPNKNYSTKLA